MLEFPYAAHGSLHRPPSLGDVWTGVATALRAPGATDDDVVRAARADALAARVDAREAPAALGRFLVAAVSDPRIRIEAARGAALLRRFSRQAGSRPTFWSEFAVATLQRMAGHDREVAYTLEGALHRAASDGIPAATVARTAGIMAHAQQAAGLAHEARAVFRRLRDDPLERAHAVVHLGELAIAGEGVDSAVEIWLSHPAGLTTAVGVIVDECDALWARDPETSYRLVDAAIAHLRALSGQPREPGFEHAVARLAARARDNAMMRARLPDPISDRSAPPD